MPYPDDVPGIRYKPLPIACLKFTLTPPGGWQDAHYDAALAAMKSVDLQRMLMCVMTAHPELRDVIVTVEMFDG